MPLFVALLHYPMTNKNGAVVTTAVTNFDIHDIARASATFGVSRYFIVTPVTSQRDFVKRIMLHWLEGEGADYNPSRGEALGRVAVEADLGAVGAAIERDFGAAPVWVGTSAKASGVRFTIEQARERLAKGDNLCLIFGTGHGLHPEILELADEILEPINGPTPFNHLSVRSAVSIYLDRLMAVR